MQVSRCSSPSVRHQWLPAALPRCRHGVIRGTRAPTPGSAAHLLINNELIFSRVRSGPTASSSCGVSPTGDDTRAPMQPWAYTRRKKLTPEGRHVRTGTDLHNNALPACLCLPDSAWLYPQRLPWSRSVRSIVQVTSSSAASSPLRYYSSCSFPSAQRPSVLWLAGL